MICSSSNITRISLCWTSCISLCHSTRPGAAQRRPSHYAPLDLAPLVRLPEPRHRTSHFSYISPAFYHSDILVREPGCQSGRTQDLYRRSRWFDAEALAGAQAVPSPGERNELIMLDKLHIMKLDVRVVERKTYIGEVFSV